MDFSVTMPVVNTQLTGEWAWVLVDVPATYSQVYGNRQAGGFVDIVQPVAKGRLLGFDNAVLNVRAGWNTWTGT